MQAGSARAGGRDGAGLGGVVEVDGIEQLAGDLLAAVQDGLDLLGPD
jgi:hypothetical protein